VLEVTPLTGAVMTGHADDAMVEQAHRVQLAGWRPDTEATMGAWPLALAAAAPFSTRFATVRGRMGRGGADFPFWRLIAVF
jgi:hypothetical protein